MDKSLYFRDQHVLADDLNNTEDTKEEQIKDRQQSHLGDSGGRGTPMHTTPRGGVFGLASEYVQDKNLRTRYLGPEILINAGRALTGDGELLIIDSQIIIDGVGNEPNPNVVWGTTDDGSYFIKLRVISIESEEKSDDEGTSHPTRQTVEYRIHIDKDSPETDDVLLATFTIDGGVISNFNDRRQFIRLFSVADAISNDPTSPTGDLADTVQEHMDAVGTGSPSATNIHGLSLADLGVIEDDANVFAHRRDSHVPGIIFKNIPVGETGTQKNERLSSYEPTVGVPATHINFAPRKNAALIVNGIVYDTNLDQLVIDDEDDDTYFVVATGGENTEFIRAGDLSGIQNEPWKFPQYYLIAFVIIQDGLIDELTDLRRFFATNQQIVRADFAEGNESATVDLDDDASLINNLNRIRRQLGRAINGENNGWNATNVPLTAGNTTGSTAVDSLHRHARSASGQYTIPLSGVNIGTLRFGESGETVGDPALILWMDTSGNRHKVSVTKQWEVQEKLLIAETGETTRELSREDLGTLVGGPASNADHLHTHDAIADVDYGVFGSRTSNRTVSTGTEFDLADNNVDGIYNTVTIEENATLYLSGFRLICRKLIMEEGASIKLWNPATEDEIDGKDGDNSTSHSTPGAGGVGGELKSSANHTLYYGKEGVSGGAGGLTTGSEGSDGNTADHALLIEHTNRNWSPTGTRRNGVPGGNGGAGVGAEDSWDGGDGGAGGIGNRAMTNPHGVDYGIVSLARDLLHTSSPGMPMQGRPSGGGGGGGGAGQDTTEPDGTYPGGGGGGSGCSGGVIVIAAEELDIHPTATIENRGGDGGDGGSGYDGINGTAGGPGGSGGGGAGGDGGVVVLIYLISNRTRTELIQDIIDVQGGAGGGGANPGEDGQEGHSIVIQINE